MVRVGHGVCPTLASLCDLGTSIGYVLHPTLSCLRDSEHCLLRDGGGAFSLLGRGGCVVIVSFFGPVILILIKEARRKVEKKE